MSRPTAPWWRLLLRKGRRLFFDDLRLAGPAAAWLLLSPLFPALVAPSWCGALLFGGLAAVLVLATARDARARLQGPP